MRAGQKTVTIKQHHRDDCFPCCAAMAVGLPYDSALEIRAPDLVSLITQTGITDASDSDRVLSALGLELGRDYATVNFTQSGRLDSPAAQVRERIGRRRAINRRPSLNFEGRFHMVYWNRSALHGPSQARTYAWQDVEPGWDWLFHAGQAGAVHP